MGDTKMQKTVTRDLIKTIIDNYPVVPSYLIHNAGRSACLSGARRLRDLKKKGVVYTYRSHMCSLHPYRLGHNPKQKGARDTSAIYKYRFKSKR
jgi:hypothetical protein